MQPTKREVEPIESRRLRIRLIETGDLPITREWRNQPHVRQWFFDDREVSAADHQAWFDRYLLRDDDFVFVLEERTTRERVGQISLFDIEWPQAVGEYGRLIIADRHRSRGLAVEATSCLLAEVFRDWELATVAAHVYADNAPSLRVFNRCGFMLVRTDDGICRFEVTPETLR